MNILFFLKPKGEVAYIREDSTLRQVLETMEYHRYSCIPMLDENGKYVGTITEGDLLWFIKKQFHVDLKLAESIHITEVPRKIDYKAVRADADMEGLLKKAMDQNFVPVVDDRDNFIGIITRKSIIEYCYNQLLELKSKENKN